MKKDVQKLENSQIDVTLSFDGEEWAEAQKKAFNKLAAKVEIQGFRKGHAPENLVRQRVNQGQVLQDALDLVLQPAYEAVMKEEKIVPFIQPELQVTKISEAELEVKIIFTTAPEVKLGEYKNLGIEKKAVRVTAKEVEEEIAKLAKDQAMLVVKEGAAEMGDTTLIDFKGYLNGEEFEGGSAENFSLELGSNQFIPGFEEKLVGAVAGEERELNLKFPEQYVPELAGKDVTFKVKVHAVKTKEIPAINEDFVAELNYDGVSTIEELNAKVKADIKERKEGQAKNEQVDAILAKVRETSTFSIGDKLVDEEVKGMLGNLTKQVEQNGLTMEQYYQMTGKKEEDVKAEMAKDAAVNLRNFLILNEIAKAEKITVKEEEINEELQKIADQYNMDIAKVKEILANQIHQLAGDIQNRKIIDLLLENN